MVAIEPIPVSPRDADPQTIDWEQAAFTYDGDADIFALHFFGPQHPSVVFYTGNGIEMLIDPETEIIVGYQVEGYLARAVYQNPALLSYAEAAGMSPEVVAEARGRIARDARRALVESFEQIARRSA